MSRMSSGVGIEKEPGLRPRSFPEKTNLSPQVLKSILTHCHSQDLGTLKEQTCFCTCPSAGTNGAFMLLDHFCWGDNITS